MRKSGYYWVVYQNTTTIGMWNSINKVWKLCGKEDLFSDSDFNFINEDILTP